MPHAVVADTGGGSRRLAKRWESCGNPQAVLWNVLVLESILSLENPAFV